MLYLNISLYNLPYDFLRLKFEDKIYLFQTPGDYSTVTLRAGETLIVIKRNGEYINKEMCNQYVSA